MDANNYNDLFDITISNSPLGFDMAIVPINHKGDLGELNKFILSDYGYSTNITQKLNFDKGFDIIELEGKRPILFIVTIAGGNIINEISVNLKSALTYHFESLKNKNIWIPLIGTGFSELNLKINYEIITNTLINLKEQILNFNCFFTIAIPNTQEGKAFYNTINNSIIEEILNKNIYIKGLGKELATKLISESDANFYLVGSNWGHAGDQSKKFYAKQIWENGYEDGSYFEVVNSVKVNDILINKSTFATKKKENFLRFKAIGVVTSNLNNGRQLKVNWIYILEDAIDIEGLSFYRDTIATPSQKDLVTILSHISSQDFENLHYTIVHRKMYTIVDDEINQSTERLEETNITTLANLISDADTGADYLNITKDVNAFARVMAAKSFEPPLAIALLGKWGSGKSFFMRKLKEGIQNLSSINPANGFCKGIAHVHFNAWSYMDANLWASIVTRIFEGLQEYISGDSLASINKKEIEEKLTKNLNIAKEELNSLEKQNKNVRVKLFGLYRSKIIATNELKEKISEIENTTFNDILKKIDIEFNVLQKINDALNNNETFVDSTNKLKKIVPEQYWLNPSELYEQIKSKYTFIKTFFYGENWWKNCLWLVCILIVLFYTPIFTNIASLLLSWQDFTLTPKAWTIITLVGTTIVRGINTYKKFKTLIAPFWKIKVDYEKEKENTLFEFQQKEKALLLEIENNKNKINSINEQINKATQIKDNIEFRLQNALSTEALYSFIEKRANSEDYRKHLGIVSIIRKDFEVLNDLLVDHNIEADKNKESKDFRAMFDKPLERIILYIDDLDRCPEERVVEVLEAVNLLMAFPLFVVVVGVDPRWVKNALLKKHHMQFTGYIKNISNPKIETIEASNYLEKIFQIPFHLKDASDDSIKSMIKTLAQSKPNIVIPKVKVDVETENGPIIDIDNIEQPEENKDKVSTEKEIRINFNTQNSALLKKESIEALNITELESQYLQDMSEIVGNNPRAIKRFVNIYRIVKTHEDFESSQENNNEELIIIMFLLAVTMGEFKTLTHSIENYIINAVPIVNPHFDYFSRAESFDPGSNEYELKRKLNTIISVKHDNLKKQEVLLFKKHHQFIKRFTFKNI